MEIHGIGAFFRRHPVLLRLALLALLAELGYAIILPTLPLYLTETLRAPEWLVGWVVSAFAVVETLCQAPFGALGDRLGRQPLIVGGLALSALTSLLMTLIRVPLLFIPLRGLDGGGSAALWPAVLATVGDEVGLTDRATGMALFNVTYMAGLGLGPPLAFQITAAAHSRAAPLYVASGLMATAALGAALILGKSPRSRGAGTEAHQLVPNTQHRTPDTLPDEGHPLSLAAALRAMVAAARAQPALRTMFLLGFVLRFALSLLQPILVLYARQQAGLSDQQMSRLYFFPALAVGVLALPLGRLADRVPRVGAIQVGFAVAAVGLALVPAVHTLIGLAAMATVMGLAFIFAEPAWLALVSSLAPEGRQGTALGGVGAAQGLGAILGPVVGAHLYHGLGSAAPFFLCTALLAACLLLITAARPRLTPVSSVTPEA